MLFAFFFIAYVLLFTLFGIDIWFFHYPLYVSTFVSSL